MTLLRLNDVSLGYGPHIIQTQLSMAVQPGEVCCLLGANGCGKTTLLRSLLGRLPLLAGEVLLQGKTLPQWDAPSLAKIIAYVPQAHDGPFAFSALEMVLMGRSAHLSLFASPRQSDREQAMALLDSLGIAPLATRRYPSLSGGEKQLVLIARALLQQPQLLIMDEPAASLDFGHQISLLRTIRQLQQRGITILMSTHHPMHARAVADTVVLLSKETSAQQGPPATMLTGARLAAIYHVQEADINQHLGIEI